jgi:NhaP-type Na+/H+ or K+/H+ antiporter
MAIWILSILSILAGLAAWLIKRWAKRQRWSDGEMFKAFVCWVVIVVLFVASVVLGIVATVMLI